MNSKVLKKFLTDSGISVSPIFSGSYLARLFELLPGTKDSWLEFTDEVSTRGPERWLDDYDRVWKLVVEDVKARPEYTRFACSDMKRWDIGNPGFSRDTVYSPRAAGGNYISIDLKKANFQALKEAGVLNESSYFDLISKFTDSKHLQNSKRYRSVIFGNLCIPRITKVERWMINKIRETLETLGILKTSDIYSQLDDELIYNQPAIFLGPGEIEEEIKKTLGWETRVNEFHLIEYSLVPKEGGQKTVFYGKKTEHEETIHCLGKPYTMIGLALQKGKKICDSDRLFLNQEGWLCRLEGEIEIEKGD